jgi:hypothetical protein
MGGGLRHYHDIKNSPSVNAGNSGTYLEVRGGQRFLCVTLLQLNRNKLGYSDALALQRENDTTA